MTAFEEMGIMSEIAEAVEQMEWTLPTDIQSEAIPLILGGGDVLMAAETGSGKTGAFCLPVLQIVWETIYDISGGRTKTSSSDKQWRLSSTDRELNLSLSADYLSAQSKGDQKWQGCRANYGVKKDPSAKCNCFYFEVQFTNPGLARIGWSLAGANLELGCDQKSWGYGGTAKKSTAKNFENYGQTFGDKFDVIGNLIDLDRNTISFTKGGKDLGIAFRLSDQLTQQNVFFPAICIKNAGISIKFSGTDCPPNSIWVANANPNQFSSNISASNSSNSKNKNIGPKALIVEPSRELAQQTYDCITQFMKRLSGQIKQLLLIGGVNARDQMDQLSAGVDIVVGTPGRIEELISNGNLSLDSCRFFVIDEVDALIQQGNQNLLKRWHSLLPRMFSDGKRLQTIVCSATLHNFDVKKFAETVMYFPTWVDLKGEDSIPDTVHHVVYRIDPLKDMLWKSLKTTYKTDGVHTKDRLNYNQPNKETLSEAIKSLKGHYVVKAIDALNIDQSIIFCRTKLDCDSLEQHFNAIGGGNGNPKNRYSCVCLHSDRKPYERTENLNKFKQRKCNFLICTDVAARGIDIKGIPFVIQLTLPDEKSNYLHRIGRVGRAEKMGLAISLVSEVPEKVWYHSNCNSRGKGCYETALVEEGGCCVWYNELQILAEIEESLNCIIDSIGSDFKLQINEFDGKVTYGKKNMGQGYTYEGHVSQLADEVTQLSKLETSAQNSFLKFYL
ncbi:ATP-dependent RNA helicase Ddx1-like [Oppia nitens]|uniref:ATP-dependent RNA helicase Ddx1-like n=1 Tax=Oppia nitens TaxID=1686743 RepID=UPI0023DC4779|nr:ATP-dependent RNA helicase Ddx1-like [Oppia nitens]